MKESLAFTSVVGQSMASKTHFGLIQSLNGLFLRYGKAVLSSHLASLHLTSKNRIHIVSASTSSRLSHLAHLPTPSPSIPSQHPLRTTTSHTPARPLVPAQRPTGPPPLKSRAALPLHTANPPTSVRYQIAQVGSFNLAAIYPPAMNRDSVLISTE